MGPSKQGDRPSVRRSAPLLLRLSYPAAAVQGTGDDDVDAVIDLALDSQNLIILGGHFQLSFIVEFEKLPAIKSDPSYSIMFRRLRF